MHFITRGKSKAGGDFKFCTENSLADSQWLLGSFLRPVLLQATSVPAFLPPCSDVSFPLAANDVSRTLS